MKSRTMHFISALFFLTLATITLRDFLFSAELFRYGDLVWPADINKLVSGVFYTLNLDSLKRVIYSGPIFGSMYSLGLTALTAEKFMFMLSRFLIGFSPYFALYRFLSLKTGNANQKGIFIVSIFAGFLYAYNPIATTMVSTAPVGFAFSYFLIPLIFYYFDRALNEKNFSNIFITSLLTSLAVAGTIQFLVLLPVFIFLPWLVIMCFNKRSSHTRIFPIIKNFGLIILFFFLISSYWILPTFSMILKGATPQPGYLLTYDMLDVFSSKSTFLNVFRLMGAWGGESLSPIFNQFLWLALTFTIPITLMLSVLFSKKLKFYIIFLSLIVLFIIFLHKGSQPPLSGFYSSFYHIPLIGWMFRVPFKIGLILSFFVTLVISLGLYNLLILKLTKIKRYFKFVFLTFLVLSVSLISWPMFTGNFGGIINQHSYPITDNLTFLKSNTFNVYQYPYDQYLAVDLPVAFYSYSSNSNQYINFLDAKIRENVTIDKLLSPLNVKYFVAKRPFSETNALQNLDLVNKTSDSIIFEAPSYAGTINLPRDTVIVSGGLEEFLSLNSLQQFDPLFTSVLFSQNANFDINILSNCDKIVFGDKVSLLLPFLRNSYVIISPFNATYRHNPGEVWSVAMTQDPLHGDWHPYLEKRNINNWDFDYGKGLVFTWAASKLMANPTHSIENITNQWTFSSESDFDQWKKHTPENQFGTLHSLSLDDNALRIELWNSTWGWKTIHSPLVPAEYSNWYRWKLQMKGKNAHKVHIKIIEYNEEEKIVNVQYVRNIDSGSFDWKKVTVNFTPESSEARYIQLQICHGHKTEQPLPNIIWIDNVKVYDLQRFTKPLTLKIPFAVKETDNYIFLSRYFQNQQGGKIQIQLDNMLYTINTKSQFNKFIWKEIDELNLQKGRHKITLTNLRGFNAVNLFALIPKQEYLKAQTQLKQILQNKRIIYILEAEADLYHERSTISDKYVGKAINSEVLELMPTSRAWNELKILKPGNYIIAVRGKGSLNIKIGEREYITNLTQLDWTYLGPINLKNEKYDIEITPLPYHSKWNFSSESDFDQWKKHTPENQFGALHSLSLDDNALRIELHNSTWGWKTIRSPALPVKYDNYRWKFKVKGQNSHLVHAKIAEFDAQGNYMRHCLNIGIGDENFDWKSININYSPSSPKVAYMRLEIWHGHETPEPLPNKIWVDDVKVYGAQPSDLDVLWVYSTSKENETLKDIFTPKRTLAKITSYRKIDPTKYIVEVNAAEPFMLSFAEPYDPLWVAHVNGGKIQSIPLYSLVNGFWINKTGQLEITIEYEPQKYFWYGIVMTIIILLACIIYLTYDWGKNKLWKWAKRIVSHISSLSRGSSMLNVAPSNPITITFIYFSLHNKPHICDQ